eukprot:30054-Pleurochrysis_carterae.AAC.1
MLALIGIPSLRRLCDACKRSKHSTRKVTFPARNVCQFKVPSNYTLAQEKVLYDIMGLTGLRHQGTVGRAHQGRHGGIQNE